MRRLSTAVMAVAVLMTMAVPSALATGGGTPLLQYGWHDEFVEEVDQTVLDLCGVEVRTEFHYSGHSTLYADTTSRSHFVSHIVSTDPATGEILLVERNASQLSSELGTFFYDELTGIATSTYETTYQGVPYKLQIPGKGVISLDAGTVTIGFTVVTDLNTGQVISHETTFSDVHGPHPSLTQQSDAEWLEMWCGAMGA